MIDYALVNSCLAYLDPGTGSYALQVLLATLFGGAFALRQSWSGVKAWLDPTPGDHGGRATTRDSKTGIHGQSTAEVR